MNANKKQQPQRQNKNNIQNENKIYLRIEWRGKRGVWMVAYQNTSATQVPPIQFHSNWIRVRS